MINTLEGTDAKFRDLDRTEVSPENLMQFSKLKCKKLYMGQGNPKHKCRLGVESIEDSPVEKDLGVLLDKKMYEPAMCACRLESKFHPGLHQKKHGWQVKGGDFLTLLL